MNEHDPIEEMISQFQQTSPPEDVRDSNRKAVRTALQQQANTHWWQRSISLPLPAVLSTAAVLLLSLTIHLVSAMGHEQTSPPDGVIKQPGGSNRSVTTLVASAEPQYEYSETQRYISGVGVVERNIIYRIKE